MAEQRPEDPVALTDRMNSVIAALFRPEDRAAVADILLTECGPVQLHSSYLDSKETERIRLAILRVSNGDIGRFENAVILSRIDWRDVLMSASFGSDLAAHIDWAEAVTTRRLPAPHLRDGTE